MLSDEELEHVMDALAQANSEQLVVINRRLHELIVVAGYVNKRSIRVNDTVEWYSSRYSTTMRGMVIKVMRKNLEVRLANGDLWRVNPAVVKSV